MKLIKALSLCLVLALPSQAQATIAVAQDVGAQTFGASSVTTGDLTTTNGSLFIVDGCYYLQGNSFTSITDSKSNTYTTSSGELISSGDSDGRARQVYKASGTGGAGHNFTLTLSGNGFLAIAAKEVTDALASGPLDREASKSDNSGTTGLTSTATATTTQPQELLSGGACLGVAPAGTTAFTAQGGFTTDINLSHTSGGNQGILSAHKVETTTGAKTFTFDIDQSTSGTIGWVTTWKEDIGVVAVRPRTGAMILQ